MDLVKNIKLSDNRQMAIFLQPTDISINPRDWDNVSQLWCSHRRYNLGDEHDLKTFFNENYWDECKAAIIEAVGPVVVCEPLGLYDHSGITMYIGTQSDPWDSCQVGFGFVTLETLKNERPDLINETGQASEEGILWANAMLESEVRDYDSYLTGNVYEYILKIDDEEIDHCTGYFGYLESKTEFENILISHAEEEEKAIKIRWDKFDDPRRFIQAWKSLTSTH